MSACARSRGGASTGRTVILACLPRLALRCSNVILDGEAIVQDEHGRSDFSSFAEAMASGLGDLVFMAFDLLHLKVIGTQPPQNGPACALQAREGAEGLEYAGSAFVTLSKGGREAFWRDMERLRRLSPVVPMAGRSAAWVEPRVRVRARYLKGSDKLRHASLVGIVANLPKAEG